MQLTSGCGVSDSTDSEGIDVVISRGKYKINSQFRSTSNVSHLER